MQHKLKDREIPCWTIIDLIAFAKKRVIDWQHFSDLIAIGHHGWSCTRLVLTTSQTLWDTGNWARYCKYNYSTGQIHRWIVETKENSYWPSQMNLKIKLDLATSQKKLIKHSSLVLQCFLCQDTGLTLILELDTTNTSTQQNKSRKLDSRNQGEERILLQSYWCPSDLIANMAITDDFKQWF